MLHNLRCIPQQSPHEDCSLWLQAPGHVPLSVHLEGVAGEGPGAGGGAELLAGGGGLAVEGAAARQEPGQAVALPGQLQAGGWHEAEEAGRNTSADCSPGSPPAAL